MLVIDLELPFRTADNDCDRTYPWLLCRWDADSKRHASNDMVRREHTLVVKFEYDIYTCMIGDFVGMRDFLTYLSFV